MWHSDVGSCHDLSMNDHSVSDQKYSYNIFKYNFPSGRLLGEHIMLPSFVFGSLKPYQPMLNSISSKPAPLIITLYKHTCTVPCSHLNVICFGLCVSVCLHATLCFDPPHASSLLSCGITKNRMWKRNKQISLIVRFILRSLFCHLAVIFSFRLIVLWVSRLMIAVIVILSMYISKYCKYCKYHRLYCRLHSAIGCT